MEAGLRPRRLIAAIGALASLAACGGGDDGADGVPAPQPQRAAERDPAATLAAILERCHGARRGDFDAVALELREAADGVATTVAARLPSQLRVTTADGQSLVIDGDQVLRRTDSGAVEPTDEATRTSMRQLAAAIGLLCLQPLERAEHVVRLAADRIGFEVDGAEHELVHHPSLDAPRELVGPNARVVFVEWYDSGTTLMPIVVDLAGLGRRHLRFLDVGVAFDDATFELGEPPKDGRRITLGGPAPSGTPRIESVDPVSWLMLRDPGDWPARYAAYRSAGQRLGPAGYGNGGDPLLVEDEAGSWFVVPFVTARDDPDEIALGADERIVERGAGQVVVIDATAGDFEQRVARAADSIRAFAAQQQLALRTAVQAAINLIGRDLDEDPSLVRDAPLRVAIPIQD